MADSVSSQHCHGWDRSVDPARHHRDPGLPEGTRRRTRRTRAGLGSAQASAEAGRADRNFVLMAVLVQAVLGFLWVPVAGHLSDRIGRKRMYMIGSVFVGIFGFIYFALLDTKVPALIFVAIALSLLPVMTCYGPQAAMIAESFTPRLRYSGASLGYQLASIIAGGPSPFIATALFATYHSSLPIALYILLCAIIGIVATVLRTDYTNKDISAEDERV